MQITKKLSEWTHRTYDWVIGWSEHKWALPVLCAISFTEASFFLIPPDILLIALAAGKPKRALIYAFWTTVFSVLGGLFGYWIGMTFWIYVKDYFFTYAFNETQFLLVQKYFQENTFTAIVIAAFTPIPFKAFTVVGGVLGAPLIPFILGSIFGRGARYFLLGVLFFLFGDKIRHFVEKHFERVTILITIVGVAAVVLYWYLKQNG